MHGPRHDVREDGESASELSILRDVLRMLPNGVTVQDEHGRVLLANNAAAAQLPIRADGVVEHAEADQPPAVFSHGSSKRAPKMASVPTANNLYPGARSDASLERQAHDDDHGVIAPKPLPRIRPGFTPRCNPSLGNSPNRARYTIKFRKN